VREVDACDLAETVREGLLVLDFDLTIRFANRSFCTHLHRARGFRRPEALQARQRTVGHPNSAGAVAGLVGIESGVVSGLPNPNDSALERRVETTPWKALPRSLRCRI
jgi:hypothetical protein